MSAAPLQFLLLVFAGWVLRATGIKCLKLPARSPNLNAFSERFVLSIKSECLDKLVPLGERHLRFAILEFVAPRRRSPPGPGSSPATSRGRAGASTSVITSARLRWSTACCTTVTRSSSTVQAIETGSTSRTSAPRAAHGGGDRTRTFEDLRLDAEHDAAVALARARGYRRLLSRMVNDVR
jgi:hypothetical protein